MSYSHTVRRAARRPAPEEDHETCQRRGACRLDRGRRCRRRRGIQRAACGPPAALRALGRGPRPCSAGDGGRCAARPHALLAPVPFPRQVFAIGLNYAAHAAEAGVGIPTFPPTFTKFPTCLTGPGATVELPSEFVDWEVELVVVIGRTPTRSPSGRMATCRRRHRRPGPVRARRPDEAAGTPVQPRQVVPRVLDRSVPG